MGRYLDFEHILAPGGLESHRRLVLDDDGRITSIERAPGPRFDGWLALPGMPNAHSHAFQRALAGYGEQAVGNDSFWSWREAMYALAGAMDAETLQVVARRAYADMLAGGYTAVAEFHYLHRGAAGEGARETALALVEAAAVTGIRLTLLPVLYQRGGFDGPPGPRQAPFLHEALEDFLGLLEALAGSVTLGVAPHSLRAVAPGTIARLDAGAAGILGADFPRHIHVSEQRREVEECLAALGRTPVAALADAVALDGNWNLVHATHATAAELERVAAAGARVVLCPLTEAYLGDGLFAAVEFAGLGGAIAVGSDSNQRLDAVEELRSLEYGQRLRLQRRACLADAQGLGVALWRRCAAAGGDALGQDAGRLAPGAWADLVVLDEDAAPWAGLAPVRALDALLTSAGAAAFGAVYVGGRRLAERGRHRDEAAVAGDWAAVRRRLAGVLA